MCNLNHFPHTKRKVIGIHVIHFICIYMLIFNAFNVHNASSYTRIYFLILYCGFQELNERLTLLYFFVTFIIDVSYVDVCVDDVCVDPGRTTNKATRAYIHTLTHKHIHIFLILIKLFVFFYKIPLL